LKRASTLLYGERPRLAQEIDNLFGFTAGEVNLDENGGIRAIIDSTMVSYERLPMATERPR
jgi:flagellar motor switch protein FliM